MFEIFSPLGAYAMQQEMDELDLVGRLQNATDIDEVYEIIDDAKQSMDESVINSVCRSLKIKGD